MSRARYERELRGVFDKLVDMCRLIEISLDKCMKALLGRDFDIAREVIAGDIEINKMEREIENACLKILLMEHPVAGDFREISAALKMITDLERIGDQTRDVAEIVTHFEAEGEYVDKIVHIPKMAGIVSQMVKDGINAYINRDLELARSLDKTDDEVDDLFVVVKGECVELIKKSSDNAEQAILFMMINKYIERIGDHAVNIGEWVEYAITGAHR